MLGSSSLHNVTDLDPIVKRLIQKAYTRDGLPECVVGLNFLFLSCLIYATEVLPRESTGFKTAVLAASFLLPLLIIGSRWALKWVRERYLVERLGYVQHKPINRKQIGLGILFSVLFALVLFGIVPRLSQPDRWLLAGTGLFGGGISALSSPPRRFVILGVVMAVTGLVVAFSGVSLGTGFTILYGVQGLVTLISGGVVFFRLIQQPVETAE